MPAASDSSNNHLLQRETNGKEATVPEKSGKNPTLIEALRRTIDEALRPWAPGTIVRRKPNLTVYLRREPSEETRADFWDVPGGFDVLDGGIRPGRLTHIIGRTSRPQDPVYWVVLDNHWDDRKCAVWIEIMPLGDPNRRGWTRVVDNDWSSEGR